MLGLPDLQNPLHSSHRREVPHSVRGVLMGLEEF
jgi:hypothetical protein